MQTSFSAQLNYAIEVLTSPAGAAGMLAWFALLIALMFSPKIKWPMFAFMMWVSTLGFFVQEKVAIPLATPLSQIRSAGRPICVALLLGLMIPAIITPRGWRFRLVGLPLTLLFIFQMILAARIAAAGVTDRAAISLIVYPLLLVALGWGLSKWLQTFNDANMVLRAIMMAGFIFLITTIYQFAINGSAIVRGNRLYGTTGNPQQAGLLIGGALPVACYFVARAKENKFFRIFAAFVAGFLTLFLLWTGSRTGILMAGVALTFMFRARIGRFVLMGIVAGLFILLGMQIYEESTANVMDMFSRGDTRMRVWGTMWQAFLENPLVGVMQGQYGVGESSYLSTAANLGIIGLVPLMAFVFMTLIELVKLLRIRKFLGDEMPIVDAIISGIVALFVSAMFEGHLLGTLTFQVFTLYAYCGLITFVQDAVVMERYQQSLEQEMAGAEYEHDQMLPSGLAHAPYA